MYALIGIALVFAAVLGGYLLESGNLYVLMQPAELLIIGGACLGIAMIANPPGVMLQMARGIRTVFQAPVITRESLLVRLRMLYEVFGFARRAGISALEEDLDHPGQSPIFSRYKPFLEDRAACEFVCDSLRMLVIGATSPHELDRLLDLDIEVQRRGDHQSVSSLGAIADALPGLGIVAAVLGVVITMEAIGGSADKVGQKIAAALVGTFLGILLCYGVVGPLAARIEYCNELRSQFLQVGRNAIVAFAMGASPILAIEFARRSIPAALRPSFVEMESAIRRDARIPAVPATGSAAAAGEAPSAATAGD